MVNFGGKRKNTRIRTHLKHVFNVITLTYNSKYLIIQKITNKFPSSVFNHRLNTIPSTCLNSHRFSLSLTAKNLTADSQWQILLYPQMHLVLVLEYSFEVLVLVLVLEHTVLVAMWLFLQICALWLTAIGDPALDGDFLLLLLLILRLSSLELSKQQAGQYSANISSSLLKELCYFSVL